MRRSSEISGQCCVLRKCCKCSIVPQAIVYETAAGRSFSMVFSLLGQSGRYAELPTT